MKVHISLIPQSEVGISHHLTAFLHVEIWGLGLLPCMDPWLPKDVFIQPVEEERKNRESSSVFEKPFPGGVCGVLVHILFGGASYMVIDKCHEKYGPRLDSQLLLKTVCHGREAYFLNS